MTRSPRFTLVALVVSVVSVGCGVDPFQTTATGMTVDVDLPPPVAVQAHAVLFGVLDAPCAELLKAPLGDNVDENGARAGEGDSLNRRVHDEHSAVQIINADVQEPEASHTFGKLTPGTHSFIVVVTDVDCSETACTDVANNATFADMQGHEVGRGCRSAEADEEVIADGESFVEFDRVHVDVALSE